MPKLIIKVAVFLLFFASSTAYSQGIYLFHPQLSRNAGGPGTHLNEIKLSSFQHGISYPFTVTEASNGADIKPAQFSDFSFTKAFDPSSLGIMGTIVRQSSSDNYEVRFYKLNNASVEELAYVIKLNSASVKAYTASAAQCSSGCPFLEESFTMVAGKMQIINYQTTPSQTFSWDDVKNTESF